MNEDPTIIGRVNVVYEDEAIVTLHFMEQNYTVDATCNSKLLDEKGIKVNDEFQVKFNRVDGGVKAELVYLPPKEITKEQVMEIRNMFKDKWNNLDNLL